MATTEFYLGRKSKFLYAIENSYGVANPATTWSWGGFVQSFNSNDSQSLQRLDGMDGENRRLVGEYYPLVPQYGASIEIIPQHLRMAYLAMGKEQHSTGTHTLTVGEELPSFCIQAGHIHTTDTFGKQPVGCVFGSMNFNWNQGDFFRITGELRAQNISKITSFKNYQTTNTAQKKYTSEQMRPFKGSDSKFFINNIDISPYVLQASIALDNDLDIVGSLDNADNGLIAEPVPQVQTQTATLTVKMKESDLWDLWKAGNTVNNCTFQLNRGVNDTVDFNLSGVKIEAANEPINVLEGIVIQELNLQMTELEIVEENSITTPYATKES